LQDCCLPTRQREDLLCCHHALAGATHRVDLLGDPTLIDAQSGAVLVQLELNVAAGLDAESPPNLQRNGDLALLCDTHAVRLASNTGASRAPVPPGTETRCPRPPLVQQAKRPPERAREKSLTKAIASNASECPRNRARWTSETPSETSTPRAQ